MFDIGIKILFFATFIFWLILFYLSFGWSRMKYQAVSLNIAIATMVSLFYSFIFLLIGSILLGIISLAWKYLPKYWPTFIEMFSF